MAEFDGGPATRVNVKACSGSCLIVIRVVLHDYTLLPVDEFRLQWDFLDGLLPKPFSLQGTSSDHNSSN